MKKKTDEGLELGKVVDQKGNPTELKATRKESQVTEYLKCIFTDEEQLEFAKDMSRQMQTRAQMEMKLKEVTQSLKGEISALEAKINDLGNKVRDGSEYRNVKCRLTMDYETGKKTLIRLDTGEQEWEKNMTPDERQIQIFVEPQVLRDSPDGKGVAK